jgi:hypothetical protein
MWNLINFFDIVSVVAEPIFRILFGGGEKEDEGPYIQTLFAKPE